MLTYTGFASKLRVFVVLLSFGLRLYPYWRIYHSCHYGKSQKFPRRLKDASSSSTFNLYLTYRASACTFQNISAGKGTYYAIDS
jgi:hypothetical protein